MPGKHSVQKPSIAPPHPRRPPKEQLPHGVQFDWRARGWKYAAGQSTQLSAADAVEYLPTLHSMHELAPVLLPVFVTEPASQVVHATAFDTSEYFPAAHAVHASLSTNLPGGQSVQ